MGVGLWREICWERDMGLGREKCSGERWTGMVDGVGSIEGLEGTWVRGSSFRGGRWVGERD